MGAEPESLNKIASFTLPLGATINMNGTALYECVAVMFIAQANGIDLTFSKQLIIIFTALLAAIGSGCCNYSQIRRRNIENIIFQLLHEPSQPESLPWLPHDEQE